MARDARSLPRPDADDLAWRVIALLNIYRLLLPMVLVQLLFFNAPSRSVGTVLPGLFIGICVAYFTFGLVCIQPIASTAGFGRGGWRFSRWRLTWLRSRS